MINWKTVLGFVFSIVFLYFAMRKIQFDQLWLSIKAVDYRYFFPAVILTILWFVFRALRWRYLLSPLTWARFPNLFHTTTIAFMVNNIFPLRVGEFVRAYLIGEKEKINKVASFSTIIWERIIDGFSLIPFLILMFFLPFPFPAWLKAGVSAMLSIYALILLFIAGLLLTGDLRQRIIKRLCQWLPAQFGHHIESFPAMLLSGLEVFKKPRLISPVLFYSSLMPLTMFLHTWLISLAVFGNEVHWLAIPLIIFMINVAVAIPSSPGYVGPFHAACVAVLALFGIDESPAFGFALLFHAANYIPSTLLGFIGLIVQNISIKEIQVDADKEKEELAHL